MSEHLVEAGSDGNLVEEFMEMERVMHSQYESINEVDTQGTNQAYVCRVARIDPIYECLDIAAPSTLRTSSGVSTFNENYTSAVGALNGNLFMHDNLLVDIAKSDTTTAATGPLFGMLAPCGDKVMGDGVINGFDAYVIASAQFGSGVYSTISRAFDEVATVNGRNDTKDRCNNDPYTRLEWQLSIAQDPCFSYQQNATHQARRKLASSLNERTRTSLEGLSSMVNNPEYAPMLQVAHLQIPKPHGSGGLIPAVDHSNWSPFGISGISLLRNDNANVQPLYQGSLSESTFDVVQASKSLEASVFEYMVTEQGKWYWINIPGVHASVDLTIYGARNRDPIGLSNVRAPPQASLTAPTNPLQYELRFVRHREFYDLDTRDCVAVTSSRSPTIVMQKGVVSLAQPVREGYQMCGFDLMLWKPANTPIHTLACPVAVATGSVTMNGLHGAVQMYDSCAYTMDAPPPAPTLMVPPAPPTPARSPAPPPYSPCPTTSTRMRLQMTQRLASSSMHECHVADVEHAMHRLLVSLNMSSLNETTTVELEENVVMLSNPYHDEQCNVVSIVTITTIADTKSVNTLSTVFTSEDLMADVVPLRLRPPTHCGNATVTISEYEEDADVPSTNIWYIVIFVILGLMFAIPCCWALAEYPPWISKVPMGTAVAYNKVLLNAEKPCDIEPRGKFTWQIHI